MKNLAIVVSLGLLAAACGDSNDDGGADMAQGLPNFGQLARGGYLLKSVVDCGGCHTSGPDKVFAGGVKFPLDDQGHYVYSRNLTPDPRTGLKHTEEQFVRAMRTGEDIHHPGSALVLMPWPNFRWMSTADLKAIYAVLKVLPAVENEVPASDKGPASLLQPVPFPEMYNEGEEPRHLPVEEAQEPFGPPNMPTPVPDPGNAVRGAATMPLSYAKMPNFPKRTAAEQASFGRGAYLVNAAACNDCHTNDNGLPRDWFGTLRVPANYYLTGGSVFSTPPGLDTMLGQTRSMGANLIGPSGFFNRPGMTFLVFRENIQSMSHADQSPVLPIAWPMPAASLRTLSQDDLLDIYTHLKILAEDYDHTDQIDKQTQSQARYCTSNNDCTRTNESCFVDSSADKAVNNQCVGRSCQADSDCDACQTCGGSGCQAPTADSACLARGR